jgi:HlyD family secretion protein
MIPTPRQLRSSPALLWSTLGLIALAITLPMIGLKRLAHGPMPLAEATATSDKLPADQIRVSAMGQIEPVSGVIKVGGPVNEILGQLLVKEGDWIAKDQIIGYLRSYHEQREQLEKARQDLATAQARLVAETQYSEAQVQERTIDSVKAPFAQDSAIAAQQAQINGLKAEQDLALKELSRYEFLVSQGAAPRQTLDEKQSQADQLSQRIQQAQETLGQLSSARDRELANVRAQVRTSRTNTARVQSNSDVAAGQRAIALAQVRLNNTIIRAPRQGTVLQILTEEGESIGDEGKGKGSILQLADTTAMQVVAEVNESDVQKIKLGQSATITSRNKAFEGALQGKVSEIGRQIFKNNVLSDDPSALSDARVVQVKVLLKKSQAVAKFTNLQVDVSIDIQPPSASSAFRQGVP